MLLHVPRPPQARLGLPHPPRPAVRGPAAAAAVAASAAATAAAAAAARLGGRRARPSVLRPRRLSTYPVAAVPPASPDTLPGASSFTRVVAPSALALALCNIDRICLAVAIVPLAAQFGWGPAVQVRESGAGVAVEGMGRVGGRGRRGARRAARGRERETHALCPILNLASLSIPFSRSFPHQGLIQSAFLWGYTATQFAGGRLADTAGGRAVLAGGISFFSLAQAGTAAALASPSLAAAGLTLPAVLLARACVGLGEGVALPSVTALITAHVPPGARATALGAAFAGFHAGNMVGLLASPLLLATVGWAGLFYGAGGAGVPLLALWLALVPKRKGKKEVESGAPSAAAAVAAAVTSATPSPPPPSRSLPPPTIPNFLRSRPVWAIIAANVANHWGYFVFLNWLPSYFSSVLKTDLRASAAWSVAPWAAMAAGAALSGLVGDWAVAGGTPVRDVRRRVQAAAFLVPAAALALLAWLGGRAGGGAAAGSTSLLLTPPLACALVTLALGAASLGQFVTNMGDVAPGSAGSLFGLCNTFGCAAGGAGVAGAGALVQASGGSFDAVFGVTAGLYLAGAAVFWAWAEGEAQFA